MPELTAEPARGMGGRMAGAALLGLAVGGISFTVMDNETGVSLILWLAAWLCLSPAIAGALLSAPGYQPRAGAALGATAAIAPLAAFVLVVVSSPMIEAQMVVQPTIAIGGAIAWVIAVASIGALCGTLSAAVVGRFRRRPDAGNRPGASRNRAGRNQSRAGRPA